MGGRTGSIASGSRPTRTFSPPTQNRQAACLEHALEGASDDEGQRGHDEDEREERREPVVDVDAGVLPRNHQRGEGVSARRRVLERPRLQEPLCTNAGSHGVARTLAEVLGVPGVP